MRFDWLAHHASRPSAFPHRRSRSKDPRRHLRASSFPRAIPPRVRVCLNASTKNSRSSRGLDWHRHRRRLFYPTRRRMAEDRGRIGLRRVERLSRALHSRYCVQIGLRPAQTRLRTDRCIHARVRTAVRSLVREGIERPLVVLPCLYASDAIRSHPSLICRPFVASSRVGRPSRTRTRSLCQVPRTELRRTKYTPARNVSITSVRLAFRQRYPLSPYFP